MGQKVNPNGLRININQKWRVNWFSEKNTAKYIAEDNIITATIQEKLGKTAFISEIFIERESDNGKAIVTIKTARLGIVLGQDGENVKKLEIDIKKALKDKKYNLEIIVDSIANVETDAKIIAQTIARSLEERANFRIVQKKAIQAAMRAGAQGIKTRVSGRLNGVDMARTEGYVEGNVPLHTLRSDIDYAAEEADTKYGKLGIKIWVYNGEKLTKEEKSNTGKGGFNATTKNDKAHKRV